MEERSKDILKSSSRKLVGKFGEQDVKLGHESLGFNTERSFIKMK